jgi:hypothetical protein
MQGADFKEDQAAGIVGGSRGKWAAGCGGDAAEKLDDFRLSSVAIQPYKLPAEVRRCPTFSSNAGGAANIWLPMMLGWVLRSPALTVKKLWSSPKLGLPTNVLNAKKDLFSAIQ